MIRRYQEGRSNNVRAKRLITRYDSVQDLSGLFRQISSIHTPEIPIVDPVDLYLSHSLYDVRAPFLNEVQQYDEINIIFNPEYRHVNSKHTIDLVRCIKICPECSKDDISRYGYRMIRKKVINYQTLRYAASISSS